MAKSFRVKSQLQGVYATGGGITEVCKIMRDKSLGNEMRRVAEVYKYIENFHGGNFTTLDNSYQNFVDYLKDTNYASDDCIIF